MMRGKIHGPMLAHIARARERVEKTKLVMETATNDYEAALAELGAAQSELMVACPPFRVGDYVVWAKPDGGVTRTPLKVKKVAEGCCVIGEDNVYVPFNQLMRVDGPPANTVPVSAF